MADEQDDKIADVAEKALSGLKEEDIKRMLADGITKSGFSQQLAAQINQALGGQNLGPPRDKLEMRRIRALKNVQLESTELEAQFYVEVQKLEAKYLALNQPLFEKRRDIINGSHEPTDEEAHWSGDEDDNDENVVIEEVKSEDDKVNGTDVDGPSGAVAATPSTGISDFWLTAFKNSDILADIITEEDEAVLKHLMDLKILYTDDTGLDFSLEFHFSENEWFTNKVLTKSYKVACEVSKEDPWAFEGAAITEGKGCSIDWKKGKNLTVKTIKKKQKAKSKGQARTITKTVPSESFFNAFSPPTMDSKDDAAVDVDDIAQSLSDDYTRAEFIRDRLVPKAVLFFTGEALEEDGDGDDDYDDFDDDEDDLEDDYNPEKQVAGAKDQCKNQ